MVYIEKYKLRQVIVCVYIVETELYVYKPILLAVAYVIKSNNHSVKKMFKRKFTSKDEYI